MKKQLPILVQESMNSYIQSGFNKSQALSIGWSEYFENEMAKIEAKYQSNFTPNWEFHCSCKDCNKSNVFKSADSIRLFMFEHKNHNTWSRRLK